MSKFLYSHFNPNNYNIYIILTTVNKKNVCAILNLDLINNLIKPVYYIGGKEKDTKYNLKNPTYVTTNPKNNDIAFVDDNKIRIFSDIDYKFVKVIGGSQEIENNSESNNQNINKSMTGTSFRVCSIALKNLYKGFLYGKFNNIKSIDYTIDGDNILVCDDNGIHIVNVKTEKICTIYTDILLTFFKIKTYDENSFLISSKNKKDNKTKIILMSMDGKVISKLEDEFNIFNFNKQLYLAKLNIISVYNLNEKTKNINDFPNKYINSVNNTPLINNLICLPNDRFIICDGIIINLYNIKSSFLENSYTFEQKLSYKELNDIANLIDNNYKNFKTLKENLKKGHTNKIHNNDNDNHKIDKIIKNVKKIITELTIDYTQKDELNKLFNDLIEANDITKLKKAYKKLSLKLHPDKHTQNSNNLKTIYKTLFEKLTELNTIKGEQLKQINIIIKKYSPNHNSTKKSNKNNKTPSKKSNKKNYIPSNKSLKMLM